MDDKLNIKDAITVLRNLQDWLYFSSINGGTRLQREAIDTAIEALKQFEIVRCKDCKHWIPYDWMFSEVWQSRNMADYPEDEIGCNLCDMAMKSNDFCSRGERREVTE